MLEKGAIQRQGQFLGNLFLVKKRVEGTTSDKFKNFIRFITSEHFRMEGLYCLKFLLEQDDLLCKINLKEAYFSVPLNKNVQKFVRFQWSSNLHESLCLCFGLGPAPRIFAKLVKVPITLLRRVIIRESLFT